MEHESLWQAAAVTSGSAIVVVLVRQWFAERRSRRALARERWERRRQGRLESVKLAGDREDDRVELVLGEWRQLVEVMKRRAEDAERREAACEDRCTALEERVKALDYDNDFLQGHIMEVERELAKVRLDLMRLSSP